MHDVDLVGAGGNGIHRHVVGILFDLLQRSGLVHLFHAGCREEFTEDLGFLLQGGGMLVDEFVGHGLESLLGVDDLAGSLFHLLGGVRHFLGRGSRGRGFGGLVGGFHSWSRGGCRDDRCHTGHRGRRHDTFGGHNELAGGLLPGGVELVEDVSKFWGISDSHRAFPPLSFSGMFAWPARQAA